MKIRHDKDGRRFVADLEGHEATLAYTRPEEGVADFRSTFVPEALRGEGVGGELVSHALDWAREEGLRVVPTCSFVESYIRRHPEYEELVGGS